MDILLQSTTDLGMVTLLWRPSDYRETRLCGRPLGTRTLGIEVCLTLKCLCVEGVDIKKILIL